VGPAGTSVGFYLAELEIGGDVPGSHIEALAVIHLKVNGTGTGRDLNHANLALFDFIKPNLHEVPGFGSDHGVENLGEVILKPVAVLALDSLIIVLEPQRFSGVIDADYEIAALGV